MTDSPLRLQVLHLPAGPDDYPFALVIDRCEDIDIAPETLKEMGKELGARTVLVFGSEVEIL